MSDIKVFVSFSKPGGAFFAGETLECNITFKNTSADLQSSPGGPRLASRVPPSPLTNGHGSLDYRRTRNLLSPNPQSNSERSRPPSSLSSRPHIQGHRSANSVNLPTTRTSPPPPSGGFTPLTLPSAQDGTQKKGHKHKRSVSVISIGAEPSGDDGGKLWTSQPPPTRPRHGRSSSLQFSPRPRPGALTNGNGGPAATWPNKSSQPSTPMIRESAEPIGGFQFPARRPSGASTGPSTPMLTTPNTPITPGGRKPLEGFKFPALPPAPEETVLPRTATPSPDSSTPNLARKITNIDLQSHVEDSGSEVAGPNSANIAAFRNINSLNDTPRSSAEFYSLANSTTDTLASEVNSTMPRLMRGTHARRHSLLSVIAPKSPETLMMGYAQVSGSFVLDGSLMQTSVFDEVKRKGVVGGQRGGGVVGIEAKKSEGSWWGLGGGLGLGVSGLTSMLSGNNMSTIAEMKTIASSKSIPILSTPQSVLFVDLRLMPGESRSYSYKFPLPESLPPSHRGKAIKITYNLVIGTQRPGKGVQHPKTVEIPFRVYPFVRSDGRLCIHDLMSPIIRLHDTSSTSCLDEQPATLKPIKRPSAHEPTMNDFLSYIDTLLGPHSSSPGHSNLLSPSTYMHAPLPTPIRPTAEEDLTPKEAIEAAILGSIRGSSNQFEIRRSQKRVASLILARPAYKLGETVTAVLDFSQAEIPCYHLHVSLESAESVAPSLALRSSSSIHRATRRIHAHYSQSTLFSQRATITLTIPSTASPAFETSGVSCVWTLRLEFITPAASHAQGEEGELGYHREELLELTHVDNRGEIWEARQQVRVESFDAVVPVKVYPNPNERGFAGGQPDVGGYVV